MVFRAAVCFTFLATSATSVVAGELATAVALGEALFFETALSANGTQSCASCHDPNAGFVDPRREADGAFSRGDDGVSLGTRHAPSAAYAALSPAFHRNDEGDWVGGQFWDGRAADLAAQAGGPILNPIELGLTSEAEAVARLAENADYVAAFDAIYGVDIPQDAAGGFAALTAALATFEQSAEFQPFDSKYDRFLRGEIDLSPEEELGRLLFFSEQFTNCNQCHQLQRSAIDPAEPFTDFRYHNIGVPANLVARRENGVDANWVDNGLLDNPLVDDPGARGAFKTPTLRNVAVTAPYMHNGVFQDLRTVVAFYNKYNSNAPSAQINPETNAPWGAPPVPETIATEELTHGPALDARRIDALVAFLRTLTDARYE
ncbi:cytochrome-c peroxidase [Tritonibacter horizontis]|uniref:Methylamine utilization protein MauG n=1 Tax=Tritonibacter horizontis TaxID=1768241 RepID=A0A132BXM6_9RHOB|nr:cytochrome c peroxidase [Tritonibacter horizontis]KUP92490.1 methylamine utilization protein MauG precursor [Tritonibacter horizontis]